MNRDYSGDELNRWYGAIKASRGDWDNLFEEISTYILPSQRNFNVRISDGSDRMGEVRDGTAIYANERLAANLHFLATNPATPWFKLKFRDNKLNDIPEAIKWLEECARLYKDALNDSNFDSIIGEFWLSLPAFGTAVLAVEEQRPEYGEDDLGKFNGLTFQSSHLARTYGAPGPDGSMRDTFTEYEINARQAYERFGDKISTKIKDAFDKADFQTKFTFCHAVYKRLWLEKAPAEEDIPGEQRAFASVHFETETGNVVEEGGYYEQPRFMPRWRKRSDDDYGYGIGEKVLPDVQSLNEAKELWFLATEKLIDSPIFMGENNAIGQIELGSRGVTTVRDINQVRFWDQPTSGFQVAEMTFADLKSDIREAFFWDRLDLPPDQAGDMTAYEFGKRLQRALQLFGPTLGRIYRESLNGAIQRGFNLMFRKQAFPPIPQSLIEYEAAGESALMDIEYDNPFARAQKSEVVEAIDMFSADLINMATAQLNMGMQDTVADLVDWDEMARRKGRTQNMPEDLLKNDAQVKKTREQRQAAIDAQRKAELEAQEAQTAKTLGETDGNNIRQLLG